MKTIADVKREVIALGFEETNEYTDLFYAAINEAQAVIAKTVLPIVKRLTIAHAPAENLVSAEPFYKVSDTVSFSADAKAYYFEASGVGKCVISDAGGIRTLEINSPAGFTAFRGFCSGETTLEISGTFSLVVRNLAMYGEIMSQNEADIPAYGDWVSYDLKLLGERFVGMSSDAQVLKDGRGYTDYRFVEGHVLMLPRVRTGIYDLLYEALPAVITKDTDDSTPLELPEETHLLVPLWVAYRCWLDDDERKATIYRNDFSALAADIKANATASVPPVYQNTTGWW